MPVITEADAEKSAIARIPESEASSSGGLSSPPGTPQIPDKSQARRSAALRDTQQFPYPGGPPPAYRSTTPSASDPSNSARSYDVGPQEPLPKDRRPAWIVRRGGWWKILLGVFIVVVAVVALAVGLAVGLRKSNSSSSSGGGSNNNSGNNSQGNNNSPVFPAGSYAFNTALDNISTACTTNSSTFRCYPYTTYAQSNSSSKAVFFWTINQDTTSSSSQSSYKISAARNPFVPQFDNVDMQLLDADTDNERLTFKFTMNAAVVPSPAITLGVGSVTCYYNNTVMGATIYTRRASSYPVGLSSSVHNAVGSGGSSSSSTSFDPWPYAVEVRQVATAGSGVPDCRDAQGNPVGGFTVAASGNSPTCSCTYQNYDL